MKRAGEEKLPSERSFGLVFAAFFVLLGLRGRRASYFLVAALFFAAAFLAPKALAPLNRAWFRLGLFLGKIVNPIVMAVLYYGALTPVAVLARLFGRDELALKPRATKSYWIDRLPPGPEAGSFGRQF